jgi:hypothetical protein
MRVACKLLAIILSWNTPFWCDLASGMMMLGGGLKMRVMNHEKEAMMMTKVFDGWTVRWAPQTSQVRKVPVS